MFFAFGGGLMVKDNTLRKSIRHLSRPEFNTNMDYMQDKSYVTQVVHERNMPNTLHFSSIRKANRHINRLLSK